jgi:hypothetical protein
MDMFHPPNNHLKHTALLPLVYMDFQPSGKYNHHLDHNKDPADKYFRPNMWLLEKQEERHMTHPLGQN